MKNRTLIYSIFLAIFLFSYSSIADSSQLVFPLVEGESIPSSGFVFVTVEKGVAIASNDETRYSRIFSVDGNQVTELARVDGINANRISHVFQEGNSTTCLIGGGVNWTIDAEQGKSIPVYASRLVKINKNGKVNTLWDSTQLPILPTREPRINLDPTSKWWAALTLEDTSTAKFMTGPIPSEAPSYTSSLSFDLSGDESKWDTYLTTDVKVIGKDRLAVLMYGRVFLMGKQLLPQHAILEPANGSGISHFYHLKTNSIWILESYTSEWSVFYLDRHPELFQEGGKVGPDLVITADLIGFKPGTMEPLENGDFATTRTSGRGNDYLAIISIGENDAITIKGRYLLPPKTTMLVFNPDGTKIIWKSSLTSSSAKSSGNSASTLNYSSLSDFPVANEVEK